MTNNSVAERIRIVRDIGTFPVESDDLELKIQIYEPDDDSHIPVGAPQYYHTTLVDSECAHTKGDFAGLSDIEKVLQEQWKYVPSSRVLLVAVTEAYKLMKSGDERAKRFLDKFMKRRIPTSERVATDAGYYGVVHRDGVGRSIYTTKCPEHGGNIETLWKGKHARTLQIITGLKEPDMLVEITKQYGKETPILMPPERLVRAVHIGYSGPLDICFGYYPDGHSGIGRGISHDLVQEK